MTDSYEDRVKAEKAQREKNACLIDQFEVWLIGKNLSERTINRHILNIDLFINFFLLAEDPISPEGGVYHLTRYFERWFPRKVMSNKSTIEKNSISIIKFYTFLAENKRVDQEKLRNIRTEIKAVRHKLTAMPSSYGRQL